MENQLLDLFFPYSLNELKLGRMAQDPFTGKPLRYTRLTYRTYDLVCDGVEALKKQ